MTTSLTPRRARPATPAHRRPTSSHGPNLTAGAREGVAPLALPVRTGLGFALLTLLLFLLAGCGDDPVSPNDGSVEVVFQVAGSGSTAQDASGLAGGVVTGTNGVLSLDRIHIVVDDFAVRGDVDGGLGLRSAELAVELPLAEGVETTAFSGPVPPGSYDRVTLQVEPVLAGHSLRPGLVDALGVWPTGATFAVSGTFTRTGEAPASFLVFIGGSSEWGAELDPRLEIEGGSSTGTIVISVDPSAWFLRGDGAVVELPIHHCDPAQDQCPVIRPGVELEGSVGAGLSIEGLR